MDEKEAGRLLRHQNRTNKHKAQAEAKHQRKLDRIQRHKEKIVKMKEDKKNTASYDIFKKTNKEKTLTPCYICHTPTEGKFCSDECMAKYHKK